MWPRQTWAEAGAEAFSIFEAKAEALTLLSLEAEAEASLPGYLYSTIYQKDWLEIRSFAKLWLC